MRTIVRTLAWGTGIIVVLPIALYATWFVLEFTSNIRNPADCSRVIGWQLARIGNRPPGEYELGLPYNPPRYELTGNMRFDDALYCTLLARELRP